MKAPTARQAFARFQPNPFSPDVVALTKRGPFRAVELSHDPEPFLGVEIWGVSVADAGVDGTFRLDHEWSGPFGSRELAEAHIAKIPRLEEPVK